VLVIERKDLLEINSRHCRYYEYSKTTQLAARSCRFLQCNNKVVRAAIRNGILPLGIKNWREDACKHVRLPPTAPSQRAIENGTALAKSNKAKSPPLAVAPGMATDTPEQYERRTAERAGEALNAAGALGKIAGVSCEAAGSSTRSPAVPSLMLLEKTPVT
jgi:hypothetical protein